MITWVSKLKLDAKVRKISLSGRIPNKKTTINFQTAKLLNKCLAKNTCIICEGVAADSLLISTFNGGVDGKQTQMQTAR